MRGASEEETALEALQYPSSAVRSKESQMSVCASLRPVRAREVTSQDVDVAQSDHPVSNSLSFIDVVSDVDYRDIQLRQ